jgi:hypothetical protein
MPEVARQVILQPVASRFAGQGARYSLNERRPVIRPLQQVTQIAAPFPEEAQAQLAAGGDPQPVTTVAEASGIWRDQADSARMVGMGVFICRPAVLQFRLQLPA